MHKSRWFVSLIVITVIVCLVLANSNKQTSQPEPTVTNDAELLLARCGKPDRDFATDYDNPRPPIPTRIIEYRKAHIKIAFFPGGGATMADPPPYQWELMGIVDTRTNKALTAKNMETVLRHRLSCYLKKE